MARVSRCDVCGHVDTHDVFHIVKINVMTEKGTTGCVVNSVDVCTECYAKLQNVLNLGDNNNVKD